MPERFPEFNEVQYAFPGQSEWWAWMVTTEAPLAERRKRTLKELHPSLSVRVNHSEAKRAVHGLHFDRDGTLIDRWPEAQSPYGISGDGSNKTKVGTTPIRARRKARPSDLVRGIDPISDLRRDRRLIIETIQRFERQFDNEPTHSSRLILAALRAGLCEVEASMFPSYYVEEEVVA